MRVCADAPIGLFDLARGWPQLRDEALEVFERIASTGAFSLGPDLRAFEAEFAGYCDAAHCVGVANGTVAIELALRGLGVGPADEVITTPHTFIATVEAIAATGATPVLADIDPRTRCIDPAAIRAAIGPRTAAVVPVHLYGRPAPMDAISRLAATHGLAVVEDAAQAHGARVDGRPVGGLGSAGSFSFYPTKNLGAMGDGGAVVTGDEALAAAVRSLRHHGCAPEDANRHERPGRTERLDNLQAALLRLKLARLDADNDARRAAATLYRERLAGLELTLPLADEPGVESVHHLFVVELDDRERVLAVLRDAGIETGVHYPVPAHLQPGWSSLGAGVGDFPHAERAAKRVLSLPCFPGMTGDEIDRVVGALRAAL